MKIDLKYNLRETKATRTKLSRGKTRIKERVRADIDQLNLKCNNMENTSKKKISIIFNITIIIDIIMIISLKQDKNKAKYKTRTRTRQVIRSNNKHRHYYYLIY